MIRGPVIALFLLAAVAGLLVWLFLENFEKREREVYVGYRGEARTNDLLAAERFLEAMGLETTHLGSATRLDEVEPSGNVAILGRRGASRATDGTARLLGWVERGGHLILAARHEVPRESGSTEGVVQARDALLEALGLAAETGFLSDEQAGETGAAALDLPDGEGFVEVDFDPQWRLRSHGAQPALVLAGEHGAHLVRISHGSGTVTVLSDLDFATNGAIARADHAEFLWRLHRTRGEMPRKAWIITPSGIASYWTRLWERGWMLASSLALMLVAWIAMAAPRFGPLVPLPTPGRRHLMEHIGASGRYYWRSGQGRRLLEASEQALLHEAGHRRAAVCTHLRAALGTREDAGPAIPPGAETRKSEFTRAVRAMESTKRHL